MPSSEGFGPTQIMEAVILCGGRGTRLKGALPIGTPKAMADINGRPFLWHLLSYWEPYVDRFILATGFGHDKIHDYFGMKFEEAEINYHRCALGTNATIKAVISDLICFPAFVINGDTLFKVDPIKMMDFHEEKKEPMTLGFSLDAQRHGGVDIVTRSVAKRAAIFPSYGYFCDIGTPETLEGFRRDASTNPLCPAPNQ